MQMLNELFETPTPAQKLAMSVWSRGVSVCEVQWQGLNVQANRVRAAKPEAFLAAPTSGQVHRLRRPSRALRVAG
jgi:hypothetical protein